MKKLIGPLLISILLVLPASAPAILVDWVEAVVNGRVITRSEVERAANVEALRRGLKTQEDYEKLRAEVIDTLIDRVLLLEEARRFNIVQVTDEEVDNALETVKKGFGTAEEFQKALGQDELTEEELKGDLRDQILAAKYVERRVKFFVRVTIDDQKDYYQQNKEKFGGKAFGEVNEEIYSLLVERETDKKLGEYLKDLRAKSEITIKRRPQGQFLEK